MVVESAFDAGMFGSAFYRKSEFLPLIDGCQGCHDLPVMQGFQVLRFMEEY